MIRGSAVRRWGPSVSWTVMIVLATSVPGDAIPHVPRIPGIDKVVHLVLYATLGWLVGGALADARATFSFGAAARAFAVIAVLAAVDEWHQQFIPGRGADALDWTADVMGAALGLALAALHPLTNTARARRETRT
jgi:VanZ family protein